MIAKKISAILHTVSHRFHFFIALSFQKLIVPSTLTKPVYPEQSLKDHRGHDEKIIS